jgi:hypothetical protein
MNAMSKNQVLDALCVALTYKGFGVVFWGEEETCGWLCI